MVEQFVENWNAANRATLRLLEAVTDSGLDAVSRPTARSVGEQFAHIHNVRLMWMAGSNGEAPGGMKPINKGEVTGRSQLRNALERSGQAMAEFIREGLERGKITGFKPNAVAFYTYMIAHEAHHRGQILLTLKLAGEKVSQTVQYGLWDWGKL